MTSPESAVTGRRVQFDRYGPADVLQIVEVPRPRAGAREVIVRVVAAGLNPGEIAIRNGALDAIFPAAFPSGQGSDFAGRVVETGPGVTGLSAGDEMLRWSDEQSAQADYVVSDPRHLTARPAALDWIRAGSLWAIGVTSFAAVRAVGIRAGEVVAVSGATGGVGRLAARAPGSWGSRTRPARDGCAPSGSSRWLTATGWPVGSASSRRLLR